MSFGSLLLRVATRLSPLIVAALLLPPAWHTHETEPAAADPAAPPAEWWATVQQEIRLAEYQVTANEGGLQAPNRAQRFRSRYRPHGIEVEPRELPASWRFSWRTARFGRPGGMAAVEPRADSPRAGGARVDYHHGGLVEWYVNRPEGLEQGFTITERPAGAGACTIEGEIGGGLRPVLQSDPEAVDWLNEAGACVLRYGELHVWDATGRELESSLAAEEGRLAILIDDDDARYPLVVDPVLSAPAWFAEANQPSTQFGASVTTAGDVNRDGYSDVLVGAPVFDNGQADEGRVFLYHGSSGGLSLTAAWTAESNQIGATFGLSAGPAGDVNGDGFADVVIGAHNFDNGQDNEGRAFLYLGSQSGLQANPAWTAEGNQVSAVFGRSCATAGDVNGDGFADVIVGAAHFDNGHTDEGLAFIYHGSAAGLATTPARTLEPNSSGARFGTSVATAGDVNADGFADVIVGAPFYSNGQLNEGAAYAYLGSATGVTATAAWFTESEQASANYGNSVAGAGDLTGDGYADVVVGAPFYSNGHSNEGRAYAYAGSAAGLGTAVLWREEPNQIGAGWGFSVAAAGDVNGDGFSDIIIGAPFAEFFDFDDGLAQVFVGSPTGPVADTVLHADQRNSRFGIAVGTAGDVNGDGYSDVLVGADFFDNAETDEGKAFLYHGAAAGLSTVLGFGAESNQTSARFGEAVAPAGDVNGDGYSDVIVGASYYDNGQEDEGRVFAFHGSPNGLATTPAWTAESDEQNGRFGVAVAGAGDVNGDGFSDVVIGALLIPNRLAAGLPGGGKAYVYHGAAAGLQAAPAWTKEGDQDGAEFAAAVAGAGDVNGDGFADVLIGAHLYDNGQEDEGMAFLYEGSPAGLSANPAWVTESNDPGARYGHSVCSTGDVNGDGFSDVLVGAPRYSALEGAVFLYVGESTGLSILPPWVAVSGQPGSLFGQVVAPAGDADGDGFSDVLIGAPTWDNGQMDEGRAHLYRGGPGGLFTAPAWTTESNQAAGFYGGSLSSAGDVNGDGFSDVVVGAPLFDNGNSDEGRAYLYQGSPQGLQTTAVWATDSNQNSAEYAYSVAGVGDVNGDGFSDVMIGAPNFDNGSANEGSIQLYYGNKGDGLDRIARQTRSGSSTPIDILGRSNSPSSFGLAALGRTPAGRGKVRLEAEVKPAFVPFDGSGLLAGTAAATGAPTPNGSTVPLTLSATGLGAGDLYHWRLRIASDSPYFPHSRWLTPPRNAVTESDVRMAFVIGVDDVPGAPPAGGPWLGVGSPNPFGAAAELPYSLPAAGRARIAVHDVAGRTVAVLADGAQAAGRHTVRWDGRTARGTTAPAGVYFVRLEFGGRVQLQKLVRAR